MAPTTTGMHRVSNVTQRSPFGTLQEVVPGATIYVTQTASGAGAVIYSDPEMSVVITGSLITADTFGWYEYYIPLSYNVTETISAPSGLFVIITNIVQNAQGGFNFVTNEIVAGVGTSFILANTPTAGSVALYNGAARLRPGALPDDYTISGPNITMNYSVSTGALLADYRY
jgi:hypothetical protein